MCLCTASLGIGSTDCLLFYFQVQCPLKECSQGKNYVPTMYTDPASVHESLLADSQMSVQGIFSENVHLFLVLISNYSIILPSTSGSVRITASLVLIESLHVDVHGVKQDASHLRNFAKTVARSRKSDVKSSVSAVPTGWIKHLLFFLSSKFVGGAEGVLWHTSSSLVSPVRWTTFWW